MAVELKPVGYPAAAGPGATQPEGRVGTVLKVLLLLVAAGFLVFLLRGRLHFDWRVFLGELRRASPVHVAAAAALILGTNWLRSWRWTVFLAPNKRVRPFSLVGTQMMGFAAVGLFGRVADLTRPYLVSRRTGVPLTTQIAVYTVERIFDLGAVAILFSTMLFLTPAGAPHREMLVRAGLLSVAGTLFLIAFAVAVRLVGDGIAAWARRLMGGRAGEGVAAKIISFRAGLRAVGSLRELLLAGGLSIAMWLMIAEAYVQSAHTFPASPTLGLLTVGGILPLMAVSMGGSLVQLPVFGWFTQVAITATSMHGLYGTPMEDATACGAVLLIVNTLIIIPVGLAFTRTEKMSLRAAALSSTRK